MKHVPALHGYSILLKVPWYGHIKRINTVVVRAVCLILLHPHSASVLNRTAFQQNYLIDNVVF